MLSERQPCPCGSEQPYPACCGRYLDGDVQPDTAEQLMRSRYTAYVLQRETYLLRTWHVSTRPATLALADSESVKWLGLRILRTEAGGRQDRDGVVEFVARYKPAGKAGRLHEISRFVRDAGQWFYLDGQALSS
jgi:SEC-C motif-containing protein